MREEYDIENLNPRKKPYSKRLKKQITINIDNETIDFFKEQSEDAGIPYQMAHKQSFMFRYAKYQKPFFLHRMFRVIRSSCGCPGNKLH